MKYIIQSKWKNEEWVNTIHHPSDRENEWENVNICENKKEASNFLDVAERLVKHKIFRVIEK